VRGVNYWMDKVCARLCGFGYVGGGFFEGVGETFGGFVLNDHYADKAATVQMSCFIDNRTCSGPFRNEPGQTLWVCPDQDC